MSLVTRLKDMTAHVISFSLVVAAMTVSATVQADGYVGGYANGYNNYGYDHNAYNNGYDHNNNNGWNCCDTSCCDVAPAPCLGWAYNPPAHEKCNCNADSCGFLNNITGRVDFLWWRASSKGTRLGYSDITRLAYGSIDNEFDETSIKSLNFKFDPGFRLGLNYYCPSNCIDISLVWTHFHSKADAKGVGNLSYYDVDNTFVNFWDHGFDLVGLSPDAVKEHWTLDMDLIDLEFAQFYYVNHCFSLRPHFDLRFARIDQNVHVESFASGDEYYYVSPFHSSVTAKNNFRGCGPRVGLDLEINLGCNIFLFGKGAASLMYGQFKRSGIQTVSAYISGGTAGPNQGSEDAPVGAPSSPITTDLVYHARGNDDWSSVFSTDFAIGLKWESCFTCCNKSHPFALAFAWEQSGFFDINDFDFISGFHQGGMVSTGGAAPTYSPSKQGNLYTQGLTVTATLGF